MKSRTARDKQQHTAVPPISAEERRHMIAEAAYYRALDRRFQGDAAEHWYAAERQIDALLSAGDGVAGASRSVESAA